MPRRDLLRQTLRAVRLPVLSAGGVSTSSDVASALDAGAAAVWLGTAFAACEESLISDRARQTLLAADGADTVVSRVLDVALGLPWPTRFSERLLRTDFVTRWQGRESQLSNDENALSDFRAAIEAEDYSVVPLDAGEGVGFLKQTLSAAQTVGMLSGRSGFGEH